MILIVFLRLFQLKVESLKAVLDKVLLSTVNDPTYKRPKASLRIISRCAKVPEVFTLNGPSPYRTFPGGIRSSFGPRFGPGPTAGSVPCTLPFLETFCKLQQKKSAHSSTRPSGTGRFRGNKGQVSPTSSCLRYNRPSVSLLNSKTFQRKRRIKTIGRF